MKFITVAALSLFALSAFADESLDSMKMSANEHITHKMDNLQKSKTCIDGAKTKEAFKACKFDMHESMKMQKEEMMDKAKSKKW